eukprot:4536778-Amphidinium_carterae.1
MQRKLPQCRRNLSRVASLVATSQGARSWGHLDSNAAHEHQTSSQVFLLQASISNLSFLLVEQTGAKAAGQGHRHLPILAIKCAALTMCRSSWSRLCTSGHCLSWSAAALSLRCVSKPDKLFKRSSQSCLVCSSIPHPLKGGACWWRVCQFSPYDSM